MEENQRRRQTAHEMWLLQLTPEQRAELDAGDEGYGELWVPDEASEVLAAVAGMKYPCHRQHRHETWCLPVNEMGEALQRAIERRD